MNDKITQSLKRLFEHHRIIFWGDATGEMAEEFDAITLDGVSKLTIQNNEFGLKYRMLTAEPDTCFLVYRPGAQPELLDNWLLDLELSCGTFRADQAAMWLSELDLDLTFGPLVTDHKEFFSLAKRREKLKALLGGKESLGQIRLSMLAVCTESDPRLDSVLESLLLKHSRGEEGAWHLIARCHLEGFLWGQAKRHYGYDSPKPSVEDFAITLFDACYALGLGMSAKLSGEAEVFLKRFKDSRRYGEAFGVLSGKYAGVLGIEADLNKRDLRELLQVDLFELIDRKVLSDLVSLVAAQTVSKTEVSQWVRARREGHWFERFEHPYGAIEAAAQMLSAIQETNLQMQSLSEGISRYTQSWFVVDQLYRRFVYHARKSVQSTLLAPLVQLVENHYTNTYLLKLNTLWQGHLDDLEQWNDLGVLMQNGFYQHHVEPFVQREKKVCVIVSDALRYEIADELARAMRSEDRYEAKLDAMVALLPSYTQLGMAALLPHKTLSLTPTSDVLADGAPTRGTENRRKILQAALKGQGHALQAEEFIKLSRDEARAIFQENRVLYIYHNRIDHTGDKIQSEGQVFEAAQETIGELITIVKKLANANATNLIITADHGFLYQDSELDESDYLGENVGQGVTCKNRRFLLGEQMRVAGGFKHFTSAQLGLKGSVEVAIPKSINRLRLQGSGSRFVHGGASLQEVVVPVLAINKKRQSDTQLVEVEILKGTSSTISTGLLSVALYQSEPVSEKVHPRRLRAGLYTAQKELISDTREVLFDITSDNAREREVPMRFVLSREADKANGQEVFLVLHEIKEQNTYEGEYKSLRYLLQRTFINDFDI